MATSKRDSGSSSDGKLVKQQSTEEPNACRILDMMHPVDEGKCHVVEMPSNDPFLPPLHQNGTDIDDITKDILVKEGISFYPKSFSRNPSPMIQQLCSLVEEKYENDSQSLVYMAQSLAVTLNIEVKAPPNIGCDVCILSRDSPVFVLTIVKDLDDAIRTYNLDITKGLVSQVRNFTSEHFSALFGIVQEKDLKSRVSFNKVLEDITTKSSAFCIPDSLCMTESKMRNVIKALVASIALSAGVKIVKTSKSDVAEEASVRDDAEDIVEEDLWFLTRDQFKILAENIDNSGLVVIWAAPKTGSTSLLVEVASRLEKRGRTLLVSGSEILCQAARYHKVCSRVLSREEFIKLQSEMGDMLADVDHVVAEDVPEGLLQVRSRAGHSWLCMKIKEKVHDNIHPGARLMVPRPRRPTPASSLEHATPVQRETFSFKIESDSNDPWVYDFTVVHVNNRDVIVAIDPPNNRVKSFYNENGIQKSSYICIDKDTKGITNLNNMAAITIPGCRLIRVLCVTPELVPHSIIHTERRYHSIGGFGPDKMAACAPQDGQPCVDIIDLTGQILRSVTKDEEGLYLFNNPLTIHATFPTILVFDKGGLVAIDDLGRVRFKFFPEKKLEKPCGMTVASSGEILFADSRQHRVVLLTKEGKFVKEVLTRSDKIIFPYRLCCDSSGRLYVAQHYKEVVIYEFK